MGTWEHLSLRILALDLILPYGLPATDVIVGASP